jgi:hypothetical protein
MNFQECQLLRAEKVALEEMLSHTPQENVIERVGLEYRKAEIEAQLASQPSPVREPAKAHLTTLPDKSKGEK